ncbi:MAG: ABC transporter permease [Promethearchaeati archaeon SRVP18_Atabeyarchaeia-1]
MTEARAIYTLWLREVKRYFRERVRPISSFVQPALWLLIFGSGFGRTIQGLPIPYQEFLFPGIIAQTMLFTSMFMGISVIWDREFGFLKEILVAPVSRGSIFIGKMLGNSTDALIQGVITFMLGFIIQVPLNLLIFLIALPLMVMVTFGLVCIGLSIASSMSSLESFGVIQSFVTLPIFFTSGALFPVLGATGWLQTVTYFNPMTYGVDALRTIIIGSVPGVALFPLYIDILVVVAFDAIMIVIGTLAFGRRK